jgi:hypothetical protein
MKKKSEAHETLSLLFERDGVPNVMITDGAKEQVLGDFKRKARQADCHLKQTEPYSPWSNAAEGTIPELKKGVARKMLQVPAPKCLWDDCAELESLIRSHTAHGIFLLKGEVPETLMSGNMADISEIVEFRWYEWVYFRDKVVQWPKASEVLGRYLGPAVDIGPAMAAKILKQNGQTVVRSTVRPLTEDEMKNPDMKKKRDAFDVEIESRLGKGVKPDDYIDDPDVEVSLLEPYGDDYKGDQPTMMNIDDFDANTYDQYVGADVSLPRGDSLVSGRVTGQKRNHDGMLRGKANANPILDTRTYNVHFPDGSELEYAANTIAKNMWAQSDVEGNKYVLLESVVDHRKNEDAIKLGGKIVEENGIKYRVKTTKGWELCVQWKDGSTSWERLANLKESNPVEIAEYAVSCEIENEPAFSWWVPFTLKKRNRIIAAVNKRYHNKTHKFGIRMPKSVDEAYRIDLENGNTYWSDSIQKEMNAVMIAFRVLEDEESIPPAHQQINCHMVFDVKMENFHRKARLVAGGHLTDPPAAATYASVVSRESVRIALTLTALNDLDILAADVENAYLHAPISEKVWTVCGVKFGTHKGKKALIVQAL